MQEKLLTRADDGLGEGLFDSVAWVLEKIGQPDTGEFKSAVMHCVNEDSPQEVEFYYKASPLVTDTPGFRWKAVCEVCGGRGWLLANNSDHGIWIERCDDCGRFLTDGEAVTYVATLARTSDETDAVIESSRLRSSPQEVRKNVLVAVSIPVSLTYDEEPQRRQLRFDAMQNFLDHPALKGLAELDNFVDSIQVIGGPNLTRL